MTDPADHSVRSLAEILREHGLESEAGTRPGTSGPVRASQRRRGGEEPPSARQGSTGRERRSGTGRRAVDEPAAAAGTATASASAETATASAETATASAETATAPAAGVPADTKTPGSRFGRRKTDVDLPEPVAPGQGELFPAAGPTTAAIPGLRPSRTPGVPGNGATAPGSGVGARAGAPDLASTGPIPKVVLPAEPEPAPPLTARESALAWARFAAELVLALAVGVGVYYLFSVLWELLPYLAVVLAPLVLTGLVGGVAFWRRRHGQPQLETRLLLVLLFAGTLLVVVPAAGLLSGT